jgi:hypothetical protein
MPDKLEPKAEKCVFIGYPKETIGYTCYHRSEGKVFVSKNGSFPKKELLSKEVRGRKVELDKVIEPSLKLESSATPEVVSVLPAQQERKLMMRIMNLRTMLLLNFAGQQGHMPLLNGRETLT